MSVSLVQAWRGDRNEGRDHQALRGKREVDLAMCTTLHLDEKRLKLMTFLEGMKKSGRFVTAIRKKAKLKYEIQKWNPIFRHVNRAVMYAVSSCNNYSNSLDERPLEMVAKMARGRGPSSFFFFRRLYAMETNPFFWRFLRNALLGKVSSRLFFSYMNIPAKVDLPTSMLQHKVGKIFDITLSEISPLPSLHSGFWHILTITLQTVAPVWYRQWIIHILYPTVCRTWRDMGCFKDPSWHVPKPPCLPGLLKKSLLTLRLSLLTFPWGGIMFQTTVQIAEIANHSQASWSPKPSKVWFYRPI